MAKQPPDYVKDAIAAVEKTGEEVMECWNGRRVTGDFGATHGEIVGDYWEGDNQTGATRMVLVAFPSRVDARNVHCMELSQVGFVDNDSA